MHVIKRDGTLAVFNPQKIFDAVYKACKATKRRVSPIYVVDIDRISRTVADTVADQCFHLDEQEPITVEHIQDMVESQLMDMNKEIAKNYILYRQHRTDVRQMKSEIFTTIEQFMTPDISDMDEKRENANIDSGSTMGAMLKIGGTATKAFNLSKLISPKYAQMHREGKWHIHDLDFFGLSVNCAYIPADKLLDRGFSTGHGSLRTPSTIGTAATQAAIIIQSNQNDMFGGQSIPNFDYALAPYVAKSYVRNCMLCLGIRYDIKKDILKEYLEKPLFEYIKKHRHILTDEGYTELSNCVYKLFAEQNISGELDIEKMKSYALEKTDNDTYQAMEGMIHNFCSLASRAGSQVPFSSINYGTDTTAEGRMVIKNVLLATKAGLGNGETAIFPISVFRMRNGITDKGSPNYDLFKLSCEVSAQRLFPNYLNTSSSFNDPYVKEDDPRTLVASMGCLDSITCITVQTKDGRVGDRFIGEFVRSQFTDDELVEIQNSDRAFKKECIDYKVWDTYHNTFATIKNVIINPPVTDWIRITFKDSDPLVLTSDHRLQVGDFIIQAKDLKISDKLPKGLAPNSSTTEHEELEIIKIEKLKVKHRSYCLETDTDMFDANGVCVHNCRTRVIGNVHDPNNEIAYGRGNLFMVTLNLPYMALEAVEYCKQHPDTADNVIVEFYKILDERIQDAFGQLDERFEIVAKRKAKNYPFLMGQNVYLGSEKLHPDDEIREVLKHGTLTIGFIGLAETLVALVGKHHGESKEAWEIGYQIVAEIDYQCKERSKATKMNYSCMGTPAEGCCGRLLKAIRKRFGVIKGISDHEFITNSAHLPVYFPVSAYDKVRLEAPFHKLQPAG